MRATRIAPGETSNPLVPVGRGAVTNGANFGMNCVQKLAKGLWKKAPHGFKGGNRPLTSLKPNEMRKQQAFGQKLTG